MSVTLGLAGDTMLGRGVGQVIADRGAGTLWSDRLRAVAGRADLVLVNLECCVSARGRPNELPGKPFYFRAPPTAVDELRALGVRCVTLANNHALDYGPVALRDTLDHLAAAGVTAVGAGNDLAQARAPAVFNVDGVRIGVLGVADHPPEYQAGAVEGDQSAGIAYARLRSGVPGWLTRAITELRARTDVVLVTPHWGPNMTTEPLHYIQASADALLAAGATVVAGHSAHVLHGVRGPVLFDLGDLVDDYAIDPVRRNDLGAFWLLTLDAAGPIRLEVVPLRLGYASTDLATGADAAWVRDRFRQACADLGTDTDEENGHPVIRWR